MVIVRKEKFNSEKSIQYISDKAEKTENKSGMEDLKLGAAIDIGTTSIAVGLFDMENEVLLGNLTQTNCQTKFGSDVMMRIMHCTNGKEQLLHDMLIEQIENIITVIIEQNISEKYKSYVVERMTVVGNTTMCHIFLNRDVTGLSGAPFSMAYKGIANVNSQEAGFKIYNISEIIVLPNIHSHVGADAMSVLCNEKLYRKDLNEIAIDIGTNAEIILNRHGDVYVTSTAAGPAFEGKGIYSGIRAGAGAINSVKISRVNGNIILGMLDDGTKQSPKGICGSGLIDAISELLKAGVLTKDGYLLTKQEAVAANVNINLCNCLDNSDERIGNYFVLSEKNKIIVTQRDIRNVQLAKGAIQAGVEVLLEKAGITMNDIEKIKIAGVFGKFIHASSAMSFGLLPSYPDKIEFIGNAAGNGAARALFDADFVKNTEKLTEEIRHIELADENDFQNKFLNAMELKEWYYR